MNPVEDGDLGAAAGETVNDPGGQSDCNEGGIGDDEEVLVAALRESGGKALEGALSEVDGGGVVELLHGAGQISSK